MFRDADAFLHVVFDSMPSPVFVVDADVRVLHLNATALTWLATTRDSVFMRGGGAVMHCLHASETPEGCGRSEACRDCVIRGSVREAMGGGRVYREKATLQRRTGEGTTDVHLLITAAPFSYEGRPFSLLILEDVSELIQLRSLLPICASCKKIRNDVHYWEHVETYFQTRLDVQFTHSVCPECARRLYPDLYGATE